MWSPNHVNRDANQSLISEDIGMLSIYYIFYFVKIL